MREELPITFRREVPLTILSSNRLRISTQAYPGLSCVLLSPRQFAIPLSVFPIPPAPSLLDKCLIDISIGQQPAIER